MLINIAQVKSLLDFSADIRNIGESRLVLNLTPFKLPSERIELFYFNFLVHFDALAFQFNLKISKRFSIFNVFRRDMAIITYES